MVYHDQLQFSHVGEQIELLTSGEEDIALATGSTGEKRTI